jgi:hypothetical protein
MIDTGYDEQIQYQAQQTFRADDAVSSFFNLNFYRKIVLF